MVVKVLSLRGAVCFVDKPSGQLVHSSAWAGPPERSLVDDVRATLGPGWHPLHRLDRQTSGVVAFAREGAVAMLQEALAGAEVDKRYWALVRGHVRGVHDIDHAIADEETGVARPARSVVTPLLCSAVERCSLVEVRLFSGRRHQARRHLKHISHPVIGDASHGKGPLNRMYRARFGLSRMALHARSLLLTVPPPLEGAGSRAPVVAPLPDSLHDPLARLFDSDALAALESRVPNEG